MYRAERFKLAHEIKLIRQSSLGSFTNTPWYDHYRPETRIIVGYFIKNLPYKVFRFLANLGHFVTLKWYFSSPRCVQNMFHVFLHVYWWVYLNLLHIHWNWLFLLFKWLIKRALTLAWKLSAKFAGTAWHPSLFFQCWWAPSVLFKLIDHFLVKRCHCTINDTFPQTVC